jgi:hypothetical protein
MYKPFLSRILKSLKDKISFLKEVIVKTNQENVFLWKENEGGK